MNIEKEIAGVERVKDLLCNVHEDDLLPRAEAHLINAAVVELEELLHAVKALQYSVRHELE